MKTKTVPGRLPVVILGPIMDRAARWYGKYHLNASRDGITFGPYDTVEAACAAIEAVGGYRRRIPDPKSGPHYDYVGRDDEFAD